MTGVYLWQRLANSEHHVPGTAVTMVNKMQPMLTTSDPFGINFLLDHNWTCHDPWALCIGHTAILLPQVSSTQNQDFTSKMNTFEFHFQKWKFEYFPTTFSLEGVGRMPLFSYLTSVPPACLLEVDSYGFKMSRSWRESLLSIWLCKVLHN